MKAFEIVNILPKGLMRDIGPGIGIFQILSLSNLDSGIEALMKGLRNNTNRNSWPRRLDSIFVLAP
jgi:hypothetical protein